MSFLSGSPWQQPGIISGSKEYGQPSNGHQQQQHKPSITLSAANVPAVQASSPLSPSSPASVQNRDCQIAPGGQVASATQAGSRITLREDDVKFGRGRTEVTPSGPAPDVPGVAGVKMPALKIEDEWSRGGRPREDGQRVGGVGASLGSAGQSPSSPLSSHSSPPSSIPSPSISPGRAFPNSTLDPKPTCSPNFGQSKPQQKNTGIQGGFYIQGTQVAATSQGSLSPAKQASEPEGRSSLNTLFTGSTTASLGNKEDEKKSVSSSVPGNQLGNQKENSIQSVGNQMFKPYLGKQRVDTPPSGIACPAADPKGSKAAGIEGPTTVPPAASASKATIGAESGLERENLNHTEKGKTGSGSTPRDITESGLASHTVSQNLSRTEDGRVGSCATLNRETKTGCTTEPPQRAAVRRAMSDCSHLSVPMVMAGTYPTGVGGLPVMAPNVPNFALMGAACPPRPPYPHVAVRRSFTVTDGTEAAAAMATMMSSPLMTSPVLPSSPPPKRHQGSCETSFLLPVPSTVGSSISSTQDSKLNTAGKTSFLSVQVWDG